VVVIDQGNAIHRMEFSGKKTPEEILAMFEHCFLDPLPVPVRKAHVFTLATE